MASQYGINDGYHGKRTVSGERFNTHATSPYTVAHKRRSFGTMLTITNRANSRSIRARVSVAGEGALSITRSIFDNPVRFFKHVVIGLFYGRNSIIGFLESRDQFC